MMRAGLAATIKARWICEQAHQQLKEKLGLDHFEGRSWQGLHRHALMTMIAYAFLQHRHLTQVGRKKESTDRRLSLACRPGTLIYFVDVRITSEADFQTGRQDVCFVP